MINFKQLQDITEFESAPLHTKSISTRFKRFSEKRI